MQQIFQLLKSFLCNYICSFWYRTNELINNEFDHV
jgi:hypothetical protein